MIWVRIISARFAQCCRQTTVWQAEWPRKKEIAIPPINLNMYFPKKWKKPRICYIFAKNRAAAANVT